MEDFIKHAMAIICMLAVAAAFMHALGSLESGRGCEGLERAETAIRQAIAAEYAVTGAYPESLDDIIQAYGLRIDQDEYLVFYMPVAENLAPDLTILPIEKEK